jgi:predicted metal-dependent peptidase
MPNAAARKLAMAETCTPQQHRGTRAIQRMVEFAPSTGGLALWVRHQDIDGRDAPAVMTNGHTIFYGNAFDRLPLSEQTAMVAHEVLHIALRHPQRALELRGLLGEVDLQLYNVCADAIVNSTIGHLSWLRLPASAVTLEVLLAHALGAPQDPVSALLAWDVERLYRAIDDRRAHDPEGRRHSARSGDSGTTGSNESPGAISPRHAGDPRPSSRREDGPRAARVRELGADTAPDLVPGPETEAAPEAEADLAREWSERLTRGHANDGAFSMLRELIADLPHTRTPWRQVLRTRLARGLSQKTDVSWSRPTRSYIANQGRGGPNRRLPFEPGFCASRMAPKLAVILDISGSVDDALMQQFVTEIAAISRRQEAGLVLVIGDDQVRRVEIFPPGKFNLDGIVIEGGGGTDFTPLIEEADHHRPDIAVVLTDLEGPARFKPAWPVIWAVPQRHAFTVPPFGRRLVLS